MSGECWQVPAHHFGRAEPRVPNPFLAREFDDSMDAETGIWNGLLAGSAVIAAVVVLALVGFGVLPAAAVLPVMAGAVWCLWKGLREYTPAQFDHFEVDGDDLRWVDR